MDAQRPKQRLRTARTLFDTGVFAPARPSRVVRSLSALRAWGPTAAAGYTAAAALYPDRNAICDERGTLTFSEVHARTNALAREMAGAGIAPGDGVAIMARNHRGFVEATVACSKLGAGALYLNTAFAGPQLADVIAREDPAMVIYDEEFAPMLGDACSGRRRLISWSAPGSSRRGPPAGRAHRARRAVRPAAPAGKGPGRDPDLRHDRLAEGGLARAAGVPGAGRRRSSRRSRCAPARPR